MMMSIECSMCECLIPLSYNVEKTLLNIQVHVTGRKHEASVDEFQSNWFGIKNITLHCCLCEQNILQGSGIFDLKYGGMDEIHCHLIGNEHSQNLESIAYTSSNDGSTDNEYDADGEYVGSNYSNGTYQTEDDYSQYEGDSDSYYEDTGDYNSNEDDSDYSDDDEEENQEFITLFFYCNVCDCNVQVSSDNEITKDQLHCHIGGQRHEDNLNGVGVSKRMLCKICNCSITLSSDIDASMNNISTHVDGNRHVNRVAPLFEAAQDNFNEELPQGLYYPD